MGFTIPVEVESSVYICTGGSSKRYHKTDECWGLNSCEAKIKEVSEGYAISIGRTRCKICYK